MATEGQRRERPAGGDGVRRGSGTRKLSVRYRGGQAASRLFPAFHPLLAVVELERKPHEAFVVDFL